MVDTGLPDSERYLRKAAEERYGQSAKPEAIVLTHGHFDHAGTALELARTWDVPIYAHLLELSYLTGASDYPPQDPTVGGALAMMSRAFPHRGYDFGVRVQPLPTNGSVPGLPGWRAVHTPGHTPGHVSLWREADRTLIAGDALATMNLDSWTSQLTHARELSRPPTPFTPDWVAARRSVSSLAELEPFTLAAGHGRSLSGPELATRLRHTEAGGVKGCDGGKKVKGRRRHILVDTQGLLLGVLVLAANISDPAGGEQLLEALQGRFGRLRHLFIDGGAHLPRVGHGLLRLDHRDCATCLRRHPRLLASRRTRTHA